MRRNGWLWAFVVSLPAVWAAQPTSSTAWAADAARSVEVEVQLVRASRGEPWVDPALRDELPDLQSLPYNRFERVGGTTARVVEGGSQETTLGLGVQVKTTVPTIGASSTPVLVHITRDGQSLARTTLERPYDRAGVISAGRDGTAMLIVPVTIHR